MKSNIANMIAN